jgi:hypothetical protein
VRGIVLLIRPASLLGFIFTPRVYFLSGFFCLSAGWVMNPRGFVCLSLRSPFSAPALSDDYGRTTVAPTPRLLLSISPPSPTLPPDRSRELPEGAMALVKVLLPIRGQSWQYLPLPSLGVGVRELLRMLLVASSPTDSMSSHRYCAMLLSTV